MEDKISDARCITHNVLLEVNSNWANNNAINANHAHQVNNLLMVHANSQDQHANATKNTTLLPTDVTLAQQVNSQITEQVVDKILDAKFTTQHAMSQANNNSHKPNASDAKHAQLDNNSLEILVKFQDQHVNAMKNTTHQPTDVIDAEQEHSLVMIHSVDKMVDAQHLLQLVTKTVKSNNHKINAMHVLHVMD